MESQAQPSSSSLLKYAFSKKWLALGHYREDKGANRHKSEIDNNHFFLSENGINDPLMEFRAWIKTLTQADENQIQQLQCKFPARFNWLAKATGLGQEFDINACKELTKWAKPLAMDNLSLVFASAYLDSPSSMFGHTYFKFYGSSSELLFATTVNYAADTRDRRGVVDFAFRGLFGGFPGVADQLPQYRRIRNYAENEGRDLWEYQLNLSKSEIHDLLLHLYEIRGQEFDYYFLDENCSYRLLSAIATVKPELELLSGFDAYAIPIDTVKTLDKVNLIKGVEFWPSATRELYHYSDQIPRKHRQLAIDIAQGQAPVNSIESESLSISLQAKAKILYLAARYSSLLINKGTKDRKKSKQVFHAITKHRLTLNEKTEWSPLQTPTDPKSTHGSRRMSLASGEFADNKFFLLEYRPAYHAFIDSLNGFNPGAEIEVLNFGLRMDEDNVRLNEFNLISVRSRPMITDYFSPPSWDFHIGVHRKLINDNDPHQASIEYSRGVTYSILNHGVSVLAGGSVNFAKALQHNLGLELLGKASILKQTNKFSYQLEVVRGAFVSGIDSNRTKINFSAGVPLADYLISLEVHRWKDADSSAALGIHYYF